MKKNKINNRFWLLLAACISIGFIAAYLIYTQYIVVEVTEIDMDLVVMDHPGINAASDALHLGGVPPGGGSGFRDFTFSNNFDFPMITTAYLEGNLTPWVTISQNDMITQPGEDSKMKFSAKPPADAEYGYYAAKVTLVHRRILW